MAFIDERLNDEIARGATFSPQIPVTVGTTRSGSEQRVQLWSGPRRVFSIDFSEREIEEIEEIRDFYIRVGGPANSFRLKDWSDFQVRMEPLEPVASTIDDNGRTDTWRIVKRYGSHVRRIDKPVDNGTFEFDASSPYRSLSSIDYSTGIVTLVGSRRATEQLPVNCEFDVRARFSDTTLEMTVHYLDSAEIRAVQLIELIGDQS